LAGAGGGGTGSGGGGGSGGGTGGGGLTAAQKAKLAFEKAKADALKYDLANKISRYDKYGSSLVPGTKAYAEGFDKEDFKTKFPDMYNKLFGPKLIFPSITPTTTVKPTPTPTRQGTAPSGLPSLAGYTLGRATAGASGAPVTANITINTAKVAPTVTAATIAKAVGGTLNGRNR
jgi:hypothetical protein